MTFDDLNQWQEVINRLKVASGLGLNTSNITLSIWLKGESQPNYISKLKSKREINIEDLYDKFNDQNEVSYILNGKSPIDYQHPATAVLSVKEESLTYQTHQKSSDFEFGVLFGEVKAMKEQITRYEHRLDKYDTEILAALKACADKAEK